MNLFILNYVKFIVQQLIRHINVLHSEYGNYGNYGKTSDKYIFYDKTLASLVPTIGNILSHVEKINLKKYSTFRRSQDYIYVINELKFSELEKKYNEMKENIDRLNDLLLEKIKFSDYFTKIPGTDNYIHVLVTTDLYKTIEYIGSAIIDILESKTSQQSLKRLSSLSGPDIYIVRPGEYREDINFLDIDREAAKEACKQYLPDFISKSRGFFDSEISDNMKIGLDKKQIDVLNICASPDDIFDKDGGREYIKRIARAYYGIKEFLPHTSNVTKHNITQLPSVRKLFSLVESPDAQDLRNAILHQCKTDILEEDKGVVIEIGKSFLDKFGIKKKEPSPNRKLILGQLQPTQVEEICRGNILTNRDILHRDFEKLGDKELTNLLSAFRAKKRSDQDIKDHTRLIDRLSTFDSETHNPEFISRQKEDYKTLGFLDKIEVASARVIKGLPSIGSMGGGGSSKRRSKTIKRRRRQQKQHKTKKYGRKYCAPRPNKKTRKHLGHRPSRPHRRTRSH